MTDGGRAPSRFETPWENIDIKENKGDADTRKCCGLRRKTSIILGAVIAAIVIIGVALGVGLGIGLKKQTPTEASSSDSPSPSGTPYVTASQTIPAWVATATTGPSQSISCPGNNLTMYTVDKAQAKKRFILLCGRDYNSQDGSVELNQGGTPAKTMTECVELCAANVGCTACGWGYDTCYMKSSIGRPNNTPGWHFAVLEPN